MASGPLDVACSMFDTFCEDSDEVALLYDLDLRYVAINRAGLAALGLERSAVLGKTNRELLGDEGEAMEEKLRSVAARGAAQTWAHVVAGEAYETTYAPVVGAGGVVGVAGRCHRTAEAAAEARARAESLAREHARATNLISMLESNPRVLTWVLDPRGELVEYVSAPACKAILGVDAATLLGTAQAALLHPDDVEAVRDALRRAEAPRRRLTYRRRVPDGSYATVALAPGAWHRDGSGRLYVQESSVSQLLNEESIAFKQMYITRTAHDLKTPITSFRLALDQLDRLLDKSTSTDESAPAWKSTGEPGRPDQTLQVSRSVTSTSIRLIFGRIDRSRRVLEAQPNRLRTRTLKSSGRCAFGPGSCPSAPRNRTGPRRGPRSARTSCSTPRPTRRSTRPSSPRRTAAARPGCACSGTWG